MDTLPSIIQKGLYTSTPQSLSIFADLVLSACKMCIRDRNIPADRAGGLPEVFGKIRDQKRDARRRIQRRQAVRQHLRHHFRRVGQYADADQRHGRRRDGRLCARRDSRRGQKRSGRDEEFLSLIHIFSVPSSLGYSSYYANVGDMVNRGVEVELNADLIRTKNVLWSFNLNLTHVKNEVTYLAPEHKSTTVEGYKGYIDGSYFVGEGLPLYTLSLIHISRRCPSGGRGGSATMRRGGTNRSRSSGPHSRTGRA